MSYHWEELTLNHCRERAEAGNEISETDNLRETQRNKEEERGLEGKEEEKERERRGRGRRRRRRRRKRWRMRRNRKEDKSENM